ncbi:phage tail tape measure protein [Rhodococcoides kyotonense]|uniref:Phage-related minor tail protein n=1 Tax=Rhodococcoides kyotonense TaxID=398843 RepID=A0A239E5F6_9NOCA|nr:phage tail tape measure protein [Rhodococcus kyotonensis]SNS39980.1 Phage-related minor tail protein [Rhodococcus kyotonensis]
MALNVGELVATLTVDDARFTRAMDDATEQSARMADATQTAGRRASTALTEAATSADRVTTSARQAREATEQIGSGAREASNGLKRIDATALTAIVRGADDAADHLKTLDKWQLDALIKEANRAGQSIGDEVRQGASHAERSLAQLDGQGLQRLIREAEEARRGLNRVADAAEDATEDLSDVGGDSGGDAGGNFLAGFSNAISGISSKAGPVAGSILGVAALGVGAGIALAAAIKEGMENELSRDIFQAQTKTTEAQAAKFARAAAEAYSDVFGESVEANLSTLKLSLQNNIIDPGASQRDAEAVVANLETISQALDGEVTTSVQAVSALMSTGLAASAQEASDMIANAVGGSANKGEDLLEVINEYSAGWKNAGISAEMALALIEQSTDNGAWNADVAGDSLREFGRRVSEEGETIVSTLNDIDLNGEEMFEAFKAGGPDANKAFDLAFDTISKIEDPVKRNTAAMGLLGDTSGDFISVLTQWDPSKALSDFGEFEGAAGRLAATMGGNDATSVEGAFRSISTVVDGFKAGLAEAFGPQIAEWANNISNNRAGVIDFFIGVGNAGFDAGEAVLRFVEGGLRGLAEFAGSAAEAGASFLDMGANILSVGESIPGFGAVLGIATDGAADKLRALADTTRNGGDAIDSTLTGAANAINDTLIPALQSGRERFNEFTGDMKLSAAFNDESAKVASTIAGIGIAADGTTMQLENFNGQIDHTNTAQHEMDLAARGLADGFREQVRTGLEAGNTVETLTGQYQGNLDTLREQLMATGMSNQAANDYINTLGLTPDLVETLIKQPGMPEAHYALDVLNDKVIGVPDAKSVVVSALTDEARDELESFGLKVKTLEDGSVSITADTEEGQRIIEEWRNRRRTLEVTVVPRTEALAAQGLPTDFIGPVNVVQNADGAFTPKNANAHITTKQITTYGEPETEGEAYVPFALSKRARSEQILALTAQHFGLGLVRMADGGIIEGGKEAAIAYAKAHDDEPYVYGELDCSGYQSGIYNKLTGKNVRFTTDSDFAALGFVKGFDPNGYTIGTNGGVGMNGHMVGQLFGVNVESGGDGIQYGGPAQSPENFPMIWHLPLSGGDDPSTEKLSGFNAENDPDGSKALAAGEFTERYRLAHGVEEDRVGFGMSSSGVGLSTDGDRVFVTNWPVQLGGKDEREPILTAGLKVFANGGFEDHSPVIVRGGDVRMFGEPETEGESYIPHAGSKRPRATGILNQTANKFGYRLVPMADGGLTGFGGYQPDSDRPTLDIPLNGHGVSANKARANAYALAALGIGGLNTLASGFDAKGNFTGQFDTSSNSPAFIEAGLSDLLTKLDELIAAAKDPAPVDVQVDIDQGSRTANISIMKAGLG